MFDGGACDSALGYVAEGLSAQFEHKPPRVDFTTVNAKLE
jgi:hypothetical protein